MSTIWIKFVKFLCKIFEGTKFGDYLENKYRFLLMPMLHYGCPNSKRVEKLNLNKQLYN